MSTNREMVVFDHREQTEDLMLSECVKKLAIVREPEYDIKGILKSFPYEIKNQELKGLMK